MPGYLFYLQARFTYFQKRVREAGYEVNNPNGHPDVRAGSMSNKRTDTPSDDEVNEQVIECQAKTCEPGDPDLSPPPKPAPCKFITSASERLHRVTLWQQRQNSAQTGT
jgi:hypothetical protein